MDNKLYAGSYLSSWREQLDEIAQQRPLHKTEKALRELITVKGQLQAKIEQLEGELKITAEDFVHQSKLKMESFRRENTLNFQIKQLSITNKQLQAKIERLEAVLDPIREWYGSGTEGNRPDVEVLHAAIADLQDDRQAVLMLREDKANLKAELDKWKPKAVDGIEAYREVKK